MGVQTRNLNDSHFAKNGKYLPKEFNDYNKMYDLYVNQHLTKEQLGKIFDCAPHVIDRVLRKLQIQVRNSSQSKIGVQCGSSHHNWKGGISALESRCRQYYQTNISPKIRKRDKFTCQLCGSYNKLHTHHIIPFSEIIKEICSEHKNLNVVQDINELYNIIINDKRFLDESNLITYCENCHLFKIHGYSKAIRSEASQK